MRPLSDAFWQGCSQDTQKVEVVSSLRVQLVTFYKGEIIFWDTNNALPCAAELARNVEYRDRKKGVAVC